MTKCFAYRVGFLLVAFLFSAHIAISEERKDLGKEVVITGRVVDPACYMHLGSKGPEHKDCAVMCAKAGQAFGILDEENDVLYQVIEAKPGLDPNKLLMEHAEEIVTVKGKLYEKSNFKAVIPTEVTKKQ